MTREPPPATARQPQPFELERSTPHSLHSADDSVSALAAAPAVQQHFSFSYSAADQLSRFKDGQTSEKWIPPGLSFDLDPFLFPRHDR